MTSPSTELRAAIITALKADAGVRATAMGSAPRIVNRARADLAFPFLVITSSHRPWDTTSDRGAEHTLEIRLMGEYEGDKEGEAIFDAVRQCLRTPPALATHRLVNLEFAFEDIRSDEDGKRYFGLQRWRAVTEE